MLKKNEDKFYVIERDGVTQGLLGMFMNCRQKAKTFLKGYSTKSVSMGLTYGTIGHAILERAYSQILTSGNKKVPNNSDVKKHIQAIEKQWYIDNPRADKYTLQNLELSLLIAEQTLPLYFDYWKKDIKEIKWKQIESSFEVPLLVKYQGKEIRVPVRGKMDGCFTLQKLFMLFESKFKSQISEGDLVDTLHFENQVRIYTWALWKMFKKVPSGVMYNVVRRSGLKQGTKESLPQYAKRIAEDIAKRPEFYFMRFEIDMSAEEIEDFEYELTEMVHDFISWWWGSAGHYKNTESCLGKYGRCNYLSVCSSKSYKNLEKRTKVFRELEDY
jgi:hypothetical protein